MKSAEPARHVNKVQLKSKVFFNINNIKIKDFKKLQEICQKI